MAGLVSLCSDPLSQTASAVDIRGFGTAGVIQTNSPYSLSEYGTAQSSATFSQLSRFGINLHQSIDPAWSFSAQLLASSSSGDLTEFLEWGFLSYSPSYELSIRAGRIVSPTWLYSQQINVGYSYPWAKLPVEVYGLNPLHSFNGVSILTQGHLGSGLIQGQLYAGDGEFQTTGFLQNQKVTSSGSAKNLVGGELSYDLDEKLMIRLSYLQTLVNATTLNPFTLPAGTLGPSQPVALNLTSGTPLDVGFSRFISMGIKADESNVFFSSEFVRRLIDGAAFTQASGFYAALGYRYWKLMPLITWSWQGALSGNSYFHPSFPTTSTLLTDENSITYGLDYYINDFAVIKAALSKTNQNYMDSTQNLSTTVYQLTADFVF